MNRNRLSQSPFQSTPTYNQLPLTSLLVFTSLALPLVFTSIFESVQNLQVANITLPHPQSTTKTNEKIYTYKYTETFY